MTEYSNYNDNHTANNNNNIQRYKGPGFCGHFLHSGRENAIRTHIVFKTGCALVNIAFVLYLIGFASPYWVVGAKHAHKHQDEFQYSCEEGETSNLSDVHFGLWEECVTCDGLRICSIFSENIDSVILMFASIGVVLLAILCCWAWLTCVRKPRKSRYLVAVVVAIIGGVFGFVSIFIFITVQEYKPYSWAFAVYLIACFLELSAAALFLLAVTRASLGGAFDEDEDNMAAPSTSQLPTILLTSATPNEKNARKRVRVLHASARKRCQQKPPVTSEEDDDVNFVTLDMLSELPGQGARGQRRKIRKKRLKKRERDAKSEHLSDTGGLRPDDTLSRGLADRQLNSVDVDDNDNDFPPTVERYGNPVRRPLIPANLPSKTLAPQNRNIALTAGDTDANTPVTSQKQGQFRNLEQFRRTKNTPNVQKSATREDQYMPMSHQEGPLCQVCPPDHRFSLSAEVYRTFPFTEALEAGDSSEEYHKTRAAAYSTRDRLESDDKHNLPFMPSSQVQLLPLLPNCQPQKVSSSPKVMHGTAKSQEHLSPCRTPDRIVGSTNKENKKNAGDSDYVRKSPDTYFQSSGNCYIFKQTTEL